MGGANVTFRTQRNLSKVALSFFVVVVNERREMMLCDAVCFSFLLSVRWNRPTELWLLGCFNSWEQKKQTSIMSLCPSRLFVCLFVLGLSFPVYDISVCSQHKHSETSHPLSRPSTSAWRRAAAPAPPFGFMDPELGNQPRPC